LKNYIARRLKKPRVRGGHSSINTCWVDVARGSRGDVVEETFGEDPFLVSQLGVCAVKGFQREMLSLINKQAVMATLKGILLHTCEPRIRNELWSVNILKGFFEKHF